LGEPHPARRRRGGRTRPRAALDYFSYNARVSQSRDRIKTAVTRVDAQDRPKRAEGNACLVVIYGPELGRREIIGGSSFDIGRSSKNDLAIDQESVSRHHARITTTGKGHVIADLSSTNGTYVNDIRVTRKTLRDGDQIKLGRSILKFMTGGNIEANYHEEIYRLMTVDALTQLYNRRYFNETLEREYNRAARYKRALSLVVFDIDHFKRINDEYGHVAGDHVLRQLAAEVSPKLREQDICSRVGGEEFAVLLPEVDLAGARIAADKVRRIVMAAHLHFEDSVIPCTVSLGVSTLDAETKGPIELYKVADDALYLAKQSGRNCVRG
jgi:two-component system cell cycle response regulator